VVRLFKLSAEEVSGEEKVQCGCCLWRVAKVFVLASSRDEALELARQGIYLCGECAAEMIAEEGYEVA
jgi:hypothetical protein